MARNFVVNAVNNGILTVPDDASLDTSTGCSVFWLQTAVGGTDGSPIFGRTQMFIGPGNANTIQCTFGGVTGTVFNGSKVVNDGNWHHVAVNWASGTGTTQQLYVDGILDISHTTVPWTQSGPLTILGVNPNGSVAEVAQWNTQLTTIEIASLASGVLPNTIRPGAIAIYLPLWS